MADEKKKNSATVETTHVDGMQVRKYKLNEGSETLFKIRTEAEIEQEIKRLSGQAQRRGRKKSRGAQRKVQTAA